MYFDDWNNLVIQEEPREEIKPYPLYAEYLPVKFVDMIYWNLKSGKDYQDASPVYGITREQCAFILNEYKPKRTYGT